MNAALAAISTTRGPGGTGSASTVSRLPTGSTPGHPRVFVDFDGVLRRDGSPRERLDADCVERFADCVLAHDAARVVIASTWRLVFTLDAMRAMFPARLVPRIEGATPQLRTANVNRIRADEVAAYLHSVGAGVSRWIAVDDKPALYGPEAPVLDVDPSLGFDVRCAARLKTWLEAAA